MYSLNGPDLIARAVQLAKRAELQRYRDGYFFWLSVSTFGVAVGLLLEGLEVLHEAYGAWRWKAIELRYWLSPPILLRKYSTPDWMKKWAAVGWLLIALGVVGEFAFEALVHKYDSQLQTLNDSIIFEAVTGVITHGPRGELIAKVAPALTKQLSAFSGQRVELFVCGRFGSQDGETLSTWGAIANILESGGAKWKVEHGGLEYFDRCSPSGGQPLGQGLMVFVSKGASKNTIDAAKALGEGLAKALPPSPDKMPGTVDPDFFHRMQEKIKLLNMPEDKDSPWAMVANDPDLITVLIGAHPQQ